MMNIGKISQGRWGKLSDPEMGVVEFRHAPAPLLINIVIKYRWYSGTTRFVYRRLPTRCARWLFELVCWELYLWFGSD